MADDPKEATMDEQAFVDPDRIERERQFHNQRFEHDDRDAQLKYYDAIVHAKEQYFARIDSLLPGADVLEYGCSYGDSCIAYSQVAKSATGIDISDTAIETGRARALAAGRDNVRLEVMNAEAMTFPDNSFDLVFGSGIIHHLDVGRSLSELKRVLRPGGRVVFVEPLGHNPAIELYRRLTPKARTPDEHPLLKKDFDAFSAIFDSAEFTFYGLSTLAVVPFRKTPLRQPILNATRALDKGLFAAPLVKWWAWYALMEGRKAAA